MKSNFYGNRKSLIAICFCSIFLFGNRIVCTAANHNEGEFVWYNGKQAITYSVSKSVSPVVTIALDMFTDDFLSKPFRVAELRARVAAHLRRQSRTPAHRMVASCHGV